MRRALNMPDTEFYLADLDQGKPGGKGSGVFWPKDQWR